MARFVLHTTNPDGPTADELDLIRQQADILDQSRRALLVDLAEEKAPALADQLPGWSVQPETVIPVPTTRQKIE